MAQWRWNSRTRGIGLGHGIVVHGVRGNPQLIPKTNDFCKYVVIMKAKIVLPSVFVVAVVMLRRLLAVGVG